MVALALLFLVGPLAPGAAATDPPAREKEAPATVQTQAEARELLERALNTKPDRYELLWPAARAAYDAAEAASGDEALALLSQAIEAGERAVQADADHVEGHFWLGASYGGYAERKGGFKAWRLTKKLRTEMEAVLRLQPDYEACDAFRALGELDLQLPWLLGGRKSRGLARLEEGCRLCPKNLDLRLSLAVAYLDEGRRDEARRELEAIRDAPVNPEHSDAERDVRAQARRRLDSIGPHRVEGRNSPG